MTYMSRASTTSRQPSPHPQATGTAATSARNGTAMTTARTMFSQPGVVSAARTGSGVRAGAVAVASGARAVAALGGGVMGILTIVEASYATVTYGSVSFQTRSRRYSAPVRSG